MSPLFGRRAWLEPVSKQEPWAHAISPAKSALTGSTPPVLSQL